MTDTEAAIYIALITTIGTQIILSSLERYKKWKDKNLKKDLIIQDLKRQKAILSRLRAHYVTLSLKYRKDEIDSYIGNAFQDLHNDVFESVEKTDLYLIFENDLPEIIGIYKVLGFLKENIPLTIYRKNLDAWYNHQATEQHQKHIDLHPKCANYFNLLKTGKDSCLMNIRTVKGVTVDIVKILNKYQN